MQENARSREASKVPRREPELIARHFNGLKWTSQIFNFVSQVFPSNSCGPPADVFVCVLWRDGVFPKPPGVRAFLDGAKTLDESLCPTRLGPVFSVRSHSAKDNVNSPGWKFNQWEMKGVPLRIELGPNDIAKGAEFARLGR